MIWIEILSRHQQEVIARFRINGPEACIGRGYDNDVIIDDPYVAAQHLRVFRDEAGQLVAEDMGSANGMFLDKGNSRLARIVVDGKQPIRIGQSYLRVRGVNYAVDQERLARPEWRGLPIGAAVALGIAILGIYALRVWLNQTSELRVFNYLTPLLITIATILVWVGIWALLSRVFSGRSRFLRNLLIALAGILAFTLYDEFARIAAFAWTWPVASNYQYVAVWSLLAVICFLHLQGIGSARTWVKAAIVTVLLIVAVAVQTLQQSETFSDSGRQTTVHQLMPPAFRAVATSDQDAFFGEIGKLKARLDSDRAQPKPDDASR